MQTAATDTRKLDLFSRAMVAVSQIVAQSGPAPPVLYGPNGKALMPSSGYTYRRDAAKRTGSLKNWIPTRLAGRHAAATERLQIVERSVDLVNNDAHAAGVVDTFAATVIGSGLTPHPALDPDILGLEKEALRSLQAQQRAVYQAWSPFADAGGRLTFGAIQYLVMRNLLQYGEYLVLLHMLKDPTRPYSLACRVVNPMRLKTPLDLVARDNIVDGVELGRYGQPAAYWIKKTGTGPLADSLPDISKNFLRIPARAGHRVNVLHGFVCQEPEQVRGIPFFAPAMKFFRDLNDFLDAELVSNIVTAAFSMFVEVPAGMNPYTMGELTTDHTITDTNPDSESRDTRYEELIPGAIYYGNPGQKPHPIAATRPGATFEPFTKVIKKAMAMAFNIPYPVLFKDVEGVNFAGFRSAMLDAWRVFTMHRQRTGQGFCQPPYTMLMEEAYLRRHFTPGVDFYAFMHPLTRCEWRGSPKGDIEPIKAVKADLLANQGKIKTLHEIISEHGGDYRTTVETLEEEREDLETRGLAADPHIGPDESDESLDEDQEPA